MSDGEDGDVLTLVTNRPAAKRDDETVAPGDAYATVKGQRTATSLKFLRRGGRSFAMPYGYLPIAWWEPPGSILIEYPGFFTVALLGITGKNPEELGDLIADHRVTRIRECDPQTAALPLAVTRIAILRSYPSRDAGDAPPSGGP